MSFLERLWRGITLFGVPGLMRMMLTPLRNAYSSTRCENPRYDAPALWLAAARRLLARPPAPAPLSAFSQPGDVRAYSANGQTVTVTCENAAVVITVLAADLMRVQLQRPGEALDIFSYALAKMDDLWPPVRFDVEQTVDGLDIRTERLVCRVQRSPCRVSFLDPQRDNAVIAADETGPAWRGDEVECSFRLEPDGHIYGLGEKACALDLRGRSYDEWNDDPNGPYPPGRDPLYLNVPFLIALHNASAFGLFFDNTCRSRIDLTASITFRAAAGPLRYYFFHGPQAPAVLARYTELTGRLRMPPLWALGYQQSRWSYTPQRRVEEIAREFRRRRIPCDAIYLDIDYMDGYRCFTWHPTRFPDPAALLTSLREQGFKVIPLIDCGIKSDRAYAVCRDGLEHGAFCRFPDGSLFRGPVWPGDCYFPDFTNARVRAWWGELHRSLLDVGVAGVWNDMNEPSIFGPRVGAPPGCVQHDWEGHGASHLQAHNVYGMQMARAAAEGLQALRPDRRTFVMTRSGWAGLQRYAMNWMGDNRSTWEHLRLTIPMIANLGLSGLAFTGPDAGGFAGDCQPELLTRWLQLGVFMPFLRNHSAAGTAAQEPWAHGEPYESINRRFIELRYQLLPYIYTAFWQCAQSGLPMLRPLFLQWQAKAQAAVVDDEFMLGDALLVAPVLEKGTTARAVYLPEGEWYDWWTARRYCGDRSVVVDAPLDRLPIFARAGSVVPAWPVVQYVGERQVDLLTLHIFPGDGESVLYEDDGESLAYQRGDFRVTRFALHETEEMLAVSVHSEGLFAPSYDEVQLVVHGVDHRAVQAVVADGVDLAGWRYDEAAGSVSCAAPLAENYVIVQNPH